MLALDRPRADRYLVDDEGLRRLLAELSEGAALLDRHRRIEYWNDAAVTITGLLPNDVLGRCCAAGVLRHVDERGQSTCAQSCPVRACFDRRVPQRGQLFLLHKQGHRVPVRVSVVPVQDALGTLRGAVELFSDLSTSLQATARIAELEQMAYIDPLTRVANRRFLEQHVSARLHELGRFGWPFGLVLFDIDRFKRVNDQHGHAVGDEVLTMVAQTVLATARPFDLVARFGGEEFVHVVGHADSAALLDVAERIRLLVRSCVQRQAGAPLAVTISAGVAEARRDDTLASLVARADQGLYASKHRGGDSVSFVPDPHGRGAG